MIWISGGVSTAGTNSGPTCQHQPTVNLTGFLSSELFVRDSDKGLGKTEEKLSGWEKLSTTKNPRAPK
jgi:hypothetical protein